MASIPSKPKSISSFSDSLYEDKLKHPISLRSYFNPKTILRLKELAILQDGAKAYFTSNKFQKAREIFDAALFAIAIKKAFSEEWCLRSSEDRDPVPDIILTMPVDNKRKPVARVDLEIMEINQLTRDSWGKTLK